MRPGSKKNLTFEQSLSRYGMMAVAAAAAAAPAQATLVVWDPADVTMLANGSTYFNMITGDVGPSNTFSANFVLRHMSFMTAFPTSTGFIYVPFRRLLLNSSGWPMPASFVKPGVAAVAARLAGNVLVDSGANWGVFTGGMASTFNYVPGAGWPWQAGDRGYLGLRFTDGGQQYYGWAEVTVNPDFTGTLHRFAYDDVAGTAVVTPQEGGQIPEPGSMSLMILGAAGLAAYRRLRKRKAA